MGGLCYNVRDGVLRVRTYYKLWGDICCFDEFKKSRAETGEITFQSSGLAGCSNAG